MPLQLCQALLLQIQQINPAVWSFFGRGATGKRKNEILLTPFRAHTVERMTTYEVLQWRTSTADPLQ